MRSSASVVGDGRLAHVPKAKRVRKATVSRRMKNVRIRYILLALAAIAAVTSLLLLSYGHSDSSKKTTIAAGGPKIVSGKVYDSMGNNVSGLNVNVTMKYDESTPRKTLTDLTDSTGFYTVTFQMEFWDIGNIIEVNASYLGEKVSNSTTADGNFGQTVDLHFSTPIPEFSDMAVIMIATATICSVFVNRHRVRRRWAV